jgi:carboxyl-terminal processing protease
VFQLPNDNYLKLTTARWYTPSGRSIQRPYGIDAPGTSAEAAHSDDPDAAPVGNDTTKKPTYKTDAGRTVYGGGGIHPDVVVMDTLTTAERALAETLQKNWLKFLEARFRYSVRYMREHPSIQPGFAVTPDMIAAFYETLKQGGIEVDRTVYDRGSSYIATALGYEISYGKWGAQEAQRRLNRESAEIRVAADLLRRASTPAALFSLADSYNAQHAMAGKKPGSPQR